MTSSELELQKAPPARLSKIYHAQRARGHAADAEREVQASGRPWERVHLGLSPLVPHAHHAAHAKLALRGTAIMQHGQILELKITGSGRERLWVYRYRLDGRSSRRMQPGGSVSADDATQALQKALICLESRCDAHPM